ncbi:MAG: glycoside hydrolase family 16 protein [Bacteroidales bacterium]
MTAVKSLVADAGLKIRIHNVAGGNPAVPGSRGHVLLFNDQYTFATKTRDGIAVFENVPSATDYTMQVSVDSDSEAYDTAVEFWGEVHGLEAGDGTQQVDFERSMPYITHLEVLNGERFAAFSAVETAKPMIIRLLVMNPSAAEVNLQVLLKLHNIATDTVITLQQPVCAAAEEQTEVLLSFTPSEPGNYLAAPALKILDTEDRYTDCWDWSVHPLFTVVEKHRMLEFAGFQWHVKSGFGPPGPNMWSDHYEHVWVDENQALHLTLTPSGKHWLATEVVSEDYFGYGTYTFFLKTDPTTLDPHAVAALFLYHDGDNEVDIEFTRWGNPDNDNLGNYVLQPADVPGNQYVFPLRLKGAFSTHRIVWQPDKVVFESWHGHYPNPEPSGMISRWEYSREHVPQDHQVRLHLNFWLFRGVHPGEALQQQFIISGFSYSAE